MSLRWRFALVLALVVAGVVVALSSAAWLSAKNEIVAGVDDALRRQANDAARGFFVGSPPESDSSRRRGPDPVQILDRQGSIVAAVGIALPVDVEDQGVAAGSDKDVLREVTVGGDDFRMLTVSTAFGAVQVARNRAEIDDALEGLRNGLVALGVVATSIAALVGWWLAGRVTRPIRKLTATTEHIAQTAQLDEPIAIERSDEVGRLASSFNAMLEALEGSRRQQQQLVMDASHELRTPLTTLRTNIELLARRPDLDDEQRHELLEAATFELQELSALVTELVDLAIERRPEEQDLEDVDLGELTREVVERAARRYGRTITLDEDEPGVVRVAPSLLERAVSNLLDNAAKFSPRDTPIDVTVDGGNITVRDHGPGIPENERTRVFDRFFRSDSARTMPGSGLGLAIVRQVVTDDGGTVDIESPQDGGGTLVRVRLPLTEHATEPESQDELEDVEEELDVEQPEAVPDEPMPAAADAAPTRDDELLDTRAHEQHEQPALDNVLGGASDA
ncbi:MAG TPA: HAMP domain-containing sensor histidine kinase [Acidimicrobiia bacterium]|jgi:two-component system sensor histidine kinase MprB